MQKENQDMLFSRQQLSRIIWPLVVEQLLSVLVGMVDVLMVSYVGEATVSGVSLVDSINHLVIQVLFAMTAGGTVVCARFIGAKDRESAKRSGGQLITITTTVMLVLSCLFLFRGRPVLDLFFGSVEADVMAAAVTYMLFTSASFPFLAVYHAIASIFRAKGNTRLSMRVSLGMNLMNIIGNAICIFGLGMGVVGVALPTLLSRITAAAAMVLFLQRPDNELRLDSLSQARPNSAILRQILSIGIPSGVESGLFNLGKVMLQSLVATLGTASIAAYAVAGNLVTYLYLPGNALGATMTTVVSQCGGAGKPEQGRYYARRLIGINYAMLAAICAAMILGRSFWVGLYHLSDQSAALAEGLLLAHSVAMVIWPVAFLLPYYFRATGRAAFTMVIAITAMAVFRIGAACIFVMVMKKNVLWVWYAMFLDWLFRVAVYGRTFLRDNAKSPTPAA